MGPGAEQKGGATDGGQGRPREFGRALMDLAWRVVDTGANCGAYNMGVDQVLAAATTQGPVLRFYGWDPPAVSCGWNQQPERETDVEACRALGIDVVRRPTGGRAVLHWEELTYSVACVPEATGRGWWDRGYAPQDRRVLGRGPAAFRGSRRVGKGRSWGWGLAIGSLFWQHGALGAQVPTAQAGRQRTAALRTPLAATWVNFARPGARAPAATYAD